LFKVVISCLSLRSITSWVDIRQRLDLEHLISDERYGTSHDRVINREPLIKTLSDRSALIASCTSLAIPTYRLKPKFAWWVYTNSLADLITHAKFQATDRIFMTILPEI